MYKKGAGNDKQEKDAENRTLSPYRNFSQAIMTIYHSFQLRTVSIIFYINYETVQDDLGNLKFSLVRFHCIVN